LAKQSIPWSFAAACRHVKQSAKERIRPAATARAFFVLATKGNMHSFVRSMMMSMRMPALPEEEALGRSHT
jgi:hypothetical protein